jgi:hypothetical protein
VDRIRAHLDGDVLESAFGEHLAHLVLGGRRDVDVADQVVGDRREVDSAPVAREVDRPGVEVAQQPDERGTPLVAGQVRERRREPQAPEHTVAEGQVGERGPHQRVARQQHAGLPERPHGQVDSDGVDTRVAQQAQVGGGAAACVEHQRVALGERGEAAHVGLGPAQPQGLLVATGVPVVGGDAAAGARVEVVRPEGHGLHPLVVTAEPTDVGRVGAREPIGVLGHPDQPIEAGLGQQVPDPPRGAHQRQQPGAANSPDVCGEDRSEPDRVEELDLVEHEGDAVAGVHLRRDEQSVEVGDGGDVERPGRRHERPVVTGLDGDACPFHHVSSAHRRGTEPRVAVDDGTDASGVRPGVPSVRPAPSRQAGQEHAWDPSDTAAPPPARSWWPC